MWPLLLDMTKEESMQNLRCLELEAYSGLVTALRAQGPLSTEKLKILRDTSIALNISQDRHKAEVRRAVNDEKLNTIAYHACGQKITSDEWAQEGRRLIPLMPRVAPQTAYSAIADEVADTASKNNKQLPNPSCTERKRTTPTSTQSGSSDNNKTLQFRMPEPPKCDEIKKRKLTMPVETSTLAQHLMGPPKISRIQQIYRQKTKARQKELQVKVKQEQDKQDAITLQHKMIQQQFQQQIQQKLNQRIPASQQNTQPNSPKIISGPNFNIQNTDEELEIKTELDETLPPKVADLNHLSPQPSSSNENHAPKPKSIISAAKLNQQITLKHMASPGPSGEKQIKVCAPRKTITTKSLTGGQKLIVVSNPQTITTSSILQRTLTIPFVKNISVKNFDKFKIVTTNSAPNIQLSPLTTAAPFTTVSAKHKVLTVRTNPSVKKVIPLSQLQVLNAKGGIKVLPIGGKIVSKSSIAAGSAPVYIVNSGNMQCLTKSTTSTPLIMTCKTQECLDNKYLLMKNPNSTNVSNNTTDIVDRVEAISSNMAQSLDAAAVEESAKSNVLADIMQAVGVVPSDSDSYTDIENEITQHTIQNSECVDQTQDVNQNSMDIKIKASEHHEALIQTLESEDVSDVGPNNDTYYIVEEKSAEELVTNLPNHQPCEVVNVVGSLDPTTGLYSILSSEETVNETHLKENQYVETTTTDMPDICPND